MQPSKANPRPFGDNEAVATGTPLNLDPAPFDKSILDDTAHRPWPMPQQPWVMTQTWNNLLFAHWKISASILRQLVPSAFELDLFDGEAWLAVVPFYMTNVGVRWMPPVPGTSQFAELNVRTYVRVNDKPGVFFFSLDAESTLAVWTAYGVLNLPYFTATMEVKTDDDVAYVSRRAGQPRRGLSARYRPVGPVFPPQPGSIEYFLTERYCLYALTHGGLPYRLDIHHRRWPLQAAECVFTDVSVAGSFGISTRAPDLLHFARRQDVVAWPPERIGGS